MAPHAETAMKNPFLGWGAVEAHRLNRTPAFSFGALAAAQTPVMPASRFAAAMARRSDAIGFGPAAVQERAYGDLPAVPYAVAGGRAEALASASSFLARERAAAPQAPEARIFH